MRSRLIAITLVLLGLSLWACGSKDDSTSADPGGPVDIPPATRGVVDAGLVILDMDADVYGPGGGTGLNIPDAGPRPDGSSASDAAVDLGGAGAACDLLAANACATGYGCYPKSDGSGTCQQAGTLFGGSNCDPSSSTPDSQCIPGYVCVIGFCTALCHLDGPTTTECRDSVGSTCVPMKSTPGIGYCASD